MLEDKPVCTDIKCPPSKICVMDENGNPGCRCLVECKKKFGTGPVCGHNGVEYPDLCDLINAECKTGDYILVRKYGSCVRKGKLMFLIWLHSSEEHLYCKCEPLKKQITL